MNKIINIGLIGCGVVGLKRISNLPKNFNFKACADPKMLSIKKKIHIKNIILTKNWN